MGKHFGKFEQVEKKLTGHVIFFLSSYYVGPKVTLFKKFGNKKKVDLYFNFGTMQYKLLYIKKLILEAIFIFFWISFFRTSFQVPNPG
jgi:hypothetical protein